MHNVFIFKEPVISEAERTTTVALKWSLRGGGGERSMIDAYKTHV
jgi:hypothetical protein